MQIVYFSSTSENTHRFVQKLTCVSHRIPLNLQEHMVVDSEYILICPTYSGGGKNTHGHVDTRGAVPKQVIHFLNDEHNRKLCRAVIGTGNTNFGDSFALAGPIIAAKVGVPLAYQFELSGTQEDVARVQMLIDEKITQPEKAPMLV
ncbi:class Ib ribonucleoside-diphosphate reductase assembly flavoprotein NrdI [Fannyhessea vaginae]|uniref:Protein NrdI n=1 Tax=Fannyhessea vaginae DSM 15829 TaxID=525256 RepID=F1T5M0_9ACTN|nr:class Ib ribonucleoside-diphosphate reductase assembly flavoprotein NrdI [Fannyhessea vaginae]EGF23154.1 nrdI protein [Fannyhessea vaginae DSM 15829]KMT47887.1 ribonucleotide reductase [Fannyhessea vaginae]QPR41485.1 class Ib ribonucleoside-diphosphate reductase assembly flavoprotein NrdI [Fannyhessea vaginae]SSZ03351.1 ribonucleotide reductase stimulatory protein [Fannyhessea vaginae]